MNDANIHTWRNNLVKHSTLIKKFTSLSLLVLAAFLLSACGAIPANNYAGLSTDGKAVYVASQSYVFAVDSGNGSVSWQYPAKPEQNLSFFGAPALADGWVYAGGYNNVAYGFALDGIDPGNPTPTWAFKEYEGKGRLIGAPAVTGDLVLFPSTDSHLYVIDRISGSLKWRLETGGALWAPAFSDENVAYQAGLDHFLYAFDLEQGKLSWKVDLNGPIVGGITPGEDGILYLGTLNQEMVAVNAENGDILWRTEVVGNIWSAPLLQDGNLYFGTDQKKIYILSASEGSITRTLDVASSIIGAPVYTDGAVAFVAEDGEVFTLTLDGENRPWTRTIKGKLYTTPVVVNGQILLAPFQGDHILTGYDFQGNLDEKWSGVKPN